MKTQIKPLEGEEYTMQKIFRDNVKFYKGQTLSAAEVLEESK